MNASAINDFHYQVIFENFLKITEPLGECNLKEFSTVASSVNP